MMMRTGTTIQDRVGFDELRRQLEPLCTVKALRGKRMLQLA